jgi:hypothetical protein
VIFFGRACHRYRRVSRDHPPPSKKRPHIPAPHHGPLRAPHTRFSPLIDFVTRVSAAGAKKKPRPTQSAVASEIADAEAQREDRRWQKLHLSPCADALAERRARHLHLSAQTQTESQKPTTPNTHSSFGGTPKWINGTRRRLHPPTGGLLFFTHGQGTRSRSLIAPGREPPVNWQAAAGGSRLNLQTRSFEDCPPRSGV